MKEGIYSKFVYRPSGNVGEYVRRDQYGNIKVLKDEFYYIGLAFEYPGTQSEIFLYDGKPARAWKDKHGNIVVRILHDDITQTKIDF